MEIDPENESIYLENKNAYLAELDELDEHIKTTLSGKEGSSFIVYHPAWGYFADYYGLIEVPVEIEGKEPSCKGYAKCYRRSKREKYKSHFRADRF